jgi:hypothetical protein
LSLSPLPMDFPPTSTGSRLKPPPRLRTLLAIGAALIFALPSVAQVRPSRPRRHFAFPPARPGTIETRFAIADGYYLYRDRIHITVEPAAAGATVPPLPEGKVKEDQFFGRVQTFRGSVIVNLALKDGTAGSEGDGGHGVPRVRRCRHLLPTSGPAHIGGTPLLPMSPRRVPTSRPRKPGSTSVIAHTPRGRLSN